MRSSSSGSPKTDREAAPVTATEHTDNPRGGDFDPRRDEIQQCPFPHYAALREGPPVHVLPGEWVGRGDERVYAVSRFDLVTQVLTDWHTFSSKFGSSQAIPPEDVMLKVREIMSKGWPRPATMLTADPPVHTRFRRLVSKAFTPKRVQDLAPDVLRICEGLVDAFDTAEGTTIDLIPTFCVPIPTSTVALALGVPEERFADFKRWADASVAPIGRQLDMDGWIGFAEGVVELQQYFAAEFEHRMDHPKDDLLTALLEARLDPADDIEGGPLEMAELLSIVQQLQVAGSETTASLIADAIVLLDDHPDEWERIAADPDRAGRVVEECLRLASPNQGLFRVVTRDTELGGVPIPQGSTLWVLYGSANRDEAMFGADAADFDADRDKVQQHVAFGKGVHYCVGAPLARLEATIALQVLARRFSKIRPVDPSALRYGPSWILRGLTSLPVELTPRG
jgi:cytochrome P450